MNIKKLCILRLSAIGDVCHAVAMVNRIQRQAPEIEITWIIGRVEYLLLKDLPNIRFVIYDKKEGRAANKKLKQTFSGEEFDVLFIMQVAFRANLASLGIKAKTKVGFDWNRSKELHWLFANKRIAEKPFSHVLEGFMGFADAIGIPSENMVSWQMPIAKEDESWADLTCSELSDFVVISPAASKAERNWSAEGYAQIADYMNKKGLKVVLCGGPAALDKQVGDEIMKLSSCIALNLIGQTSLKQMLSVLKRARLVIAPDTGPAHMATTVGTQVIGLYAHSNPRRTGPYCNLNNVVSVYDDMIEQQYGKTWQELPWGTRAKGQDLMNEISLEKVVQQVDALLALNTET